MEIIKQKNTEKKTSVQPVIYTIKSEMLINFSSERKKSNAATFSSAIFFFVFVGQCRHQIQ